MSAAMQPTQVMQDQSTRCRFAAAPAPPCVHGGCPPIGVEEAAAAVLMLPNTKLQRIFRVWFVIELVWRMKSRCATYITFPTL
mmetsp:Transcript_131879/g.422261  ORF Transcript_131879/g.422261 Transcript_131879/m.422261 type:complete len:83 (-) Transcript_131879:1609-1857(-)